MICSLLRSRVAETGAKYLSEIRSAAGRAASLTKQLLTFSRREPLEPRVLEVNKLIHDLERSMLRLLGENISVLCELMPGKKHIKVDPDQFTQIIINLAVNARDAMPAGGTLALLETEAVSTNGKSPAELPPGKYVSISVIDNGMGMTDDVKRSICSSRSLPPKKIATAAGSAWLRAMELFARAADTSLSKVSSGKGTAVHLPPGGCRTATGSAPQTPEIAQRH